jgi:hypothetical protein
LGLLAAVVWELVAAGCVRTGSTPVGDSGRDHPPLAPDWRGRERAGDGQQRDLPSAVTDRPARDRPAGPALDMFVSPIDGPKCSEPPSAVIGTSCSKQCTSPNSDGDCDGMPDNRDPAPSACNRLLLVDDFAIPPSPKLWNLTNATLSCGNVAVAAGGSLDLASPLSAPASGAASYLIETRFTVGKQVAGDWWIGVHTGVASANAYRCELWVNGAAGYQPKPGLHFTRNGPCGTNGSWDGAASIAAADGTALVLQLSADGPRMACRLFSSSGVLLQTISPAAYTGCAPTLPDRFAFAASGRPATLDWIHVYQYP